jgi:uncharacterized membrane protein
METLFETAAGYVALAAEVCCVACIAIGVVKAVIRALMNTGKPWEAMRGLRREMWARFASWILLSLEFALAADIVRTAIAPTWEDIGKLGAIAVIRTALNYFLERDLEEISPKKAEAEMEKAA